MPLAPSTNHSFYDRAYAEALRYGDDDWVFVRELLQNARDAGATSVEFHLEQHAEHTIVRYRDNGTGMSFAHSRKYLLSLYSSSKEDNDDKVGQFGVGFWSILRFRPSKIIVRSKTSDSDAWQLDFSGDLETVEQSAPEIRVGTELTLVAPRNTTHLASMQAAVERHGKYLTCAAGHSPEGPAGQPQALHVSLNGKTVNRPFTLPQPCSEFWLGSMRGVVALGSSPTVELYSGGLLVRSATYLGDLHSSSEPGKTPRGDATDLGAELSSQILLESTEIEIVLARSDVKDCTALDHLVDRAQEELDHLIEAELDKFRPKSPTEYIHDVWNKMVGDSTARQTAISVLLGALVGVVCVQTFYFATESGASLLRPAGPQLSGANEHDPASSPQTPISHTVAPSAPSTRYTDMSRSYNGPDVAPFLPSLADKPIDLFYSPASRLPYFAVTKRPLDGKPYAPTWGTPTPVPPQAKRIDVRLFLHPNIGADTKGSAQPEIRIPIPTGYAIVPGSAVLGSMPLRIQSNEFGEAQVRVPKTLPDEQLRYAVWNQNLAKLTDTDTKAQPFDVIEPREQWGQAWFRTTLDEATSLKREQRVNYLLRRVQAKVRYETTPQLAVSHEQARARGHLPVERAINIGAGDCDVQNGLLVNLLNASGTPARLAIGYVGRSGRVHPWLHAWAEYQATDGSWQVADASPPLQVPSTPTRDTNVTADLAGLDVPTDEHEHAITEAVLPILPTVTPSRPNIATEEPDPGPSYTVPIGAGLLLVLGTFTALLAGRRRKRNVHLSTESRIPSMLVGALAHPESRNRSIWERKLIPTVSGKLECLDTVLDKAKLRRLYVLRRQSLSPTMPESVSRGDALVLDGLSPEGHRLASTLTAIDLDAWNDLLSSSYGHPLIDELEQRLNVNGAQWSIRLTSKVEGQISILNLGHFRRNKGTLHLKVLLPDESTLWLQTLETAGDAKERALFNLVDEALATIYVEPELKRLTLSRLAQRVLEAQQVEESTS